MVSVNHVRLAEIKTQLAGMHFGTMAERCSREAAAPAGVMLKDMRTMVATTHAERELTKYNFVSSGNDKKDAREVTRIIKEVSTSTAVKLNNTPAMAKKAYIAPQVIRAWAERNGVRKEWLK